MTLSALQQQQVAAAAHNNLLCYSVAQWPRYQIGQHHLKIVEKLEAVERGDIKRLMIFMPPRHGKSMLASEFFPAWYLGRNPDKYVIAAAYAQELADDFGRKVRNQLVDPQFQAIFPGVTVRDDSSSAKRFNTPQGGVYYGVGIGGPVTGRGAHLLLIDDPVKNREEADSETIRRKHKDWYTSTAYTRLMPGGAIVVIQTRWHEDDLAGWLLAEHSHENWDVLELPAIGDGKALWPESYPLERLEQIRDTVGPRDWSALYQQRPAPEEGNYFLREWLRFYDDPPASMAVYGASDYAVTEDGGDYTVHGVAGVDWNDDLYILDLWRAQTSSDAWVEQLLNLADQWNPLKWAEEQGQINKSVGPFISKRQQERRIFFYRKPFASAANKATRAQAIRGRMAQGKVYLPRHAPWVPDLIHELMTFPAGKNDDQVDVLSLFGRILAEMTPGEKPAPPQKTEIDPRLPTFGEMLQDHFRACEENRY